MENLNKCSQNIYGEGGELTTTARESAAAGIWEYGCTFCMKTFSSAQALGGHQNAHRIDRIERRRNYIKDPSGYRRRAILRTIRPRNNIVLPPPQQQPPTAVVMFAAPAPNSLNVFGDEDSSSQLGYPLHVVAVSPIDLNQNPARDCMEDDKETNCCEMLDLTLKL